MQIQSEDLTITAIRFPEIKNTKQIYTASTKGQRDNKKRLLNKQLHHVNIEGNTQRILSARNHKINDQSNAIQYLTQQIEELKTENKTLKTQFYRQEKELNKIDTKQTEFPKILEQHEAEVLNLKELLRRSKENLAIETKQRKDGDIEILKLRDNLARANQLISEKNLEERSILQSQISELQRKLESSEKSLETTTKHLEYMDKTHKREIYLLKKQIQKCVNQSQDLENELEIARNNLKEKEKLLEIQNIYSHRFKMLQKMNDSSRPQSDQLLDKLDLYSLSQNNDKKEEISGSFKLRDEPSTNRIDTSKIKDDIRKIVAEEILSGRIKPFEICIQSSNDTSNNVSSAVMDNHPSAKHDNDLTDKSEVLDKEPTTQIQLTNEQIQEPQVNQMLLEREHTERQIILNKLNELAMRNVNEVEEIEDQSSLKYFANANRDSEEESIPASKIEHTSKLYKFSSTVDNLHHGVPVSQTVRSRENNKPTKPVMPNLIGNKKFQIDASHNQRNNSNCDTSNDDEILPQLSKDDKKRRESQLLTELFGEDFTLQPLVHGRPYPTGSRQSRPGSLPWQSESDSRSNSDHQMKPDMRSPHHNSVTLNLSEDIEQIVL